MRAKLISVEQPPGYSFKIYNCKCIKCGNIYRKFAYNKRTTPYCLDCIKERNREHQKEGVKRRQQERTNEVLRQIKAEIENADAESFKNPDYHRGLLFALDTINKHIGEKE
jgi:predicted  nucleic acid-binding Zn-ribbon protein